MSEPQCLWADARNSRVLSGDVCVTCGAVASGDPNERPPCGLQAPTVRPAVALYWKGEVHTALVGSPDQIAARVEEELFDTLARGHLEDDGQRRRWCVQCDTPHPCQSVIAYQHLKARIPALLGITTEARDA